MTKWEYFSYLKAIAPLEESHRNAATLKDLNDYGKEGWELVSIVVDNLGHWRYTFKRPVIT